MSAPLNRPTTSLTLVKSDSYKTISNLELVKLCAYSKNEALWEEFYRRFSKYIKLYVRKAWKNRVSSTNVDNANSKEALRDLSQEVYVKILESDSKALRNFQGQSESSFFAYLAKISSNIVSEYSRKQLAEKRRGLEMSMETLLDEETCELFGSRSFTHDYLSVDGEQSCFTQVASQQISSLVETFLDSSNSRRDFMVFKLSVVEGLSSKQIIETANLDLKSNSIESIIRRVKEKIRFIVKSKENINLPLKKAA